jgi:hypothetical protein
MTTQLAPQTTQLAANSMSLPPPDSLAFDLLDGDRVVGWISGRAVGFRGFATEHEAAHAAWVAHRTIARQRARRHGGRPVPIDVEPLSLRQDADRAVILAGGRPVATLVRPDADSRSGPDSFGFEIEVPLAAGELPMRSIAHHVYHTLRKSGLRWAMWNARRANPLAVTEQREPEPLPASVSVADSPSATAFVSKVVLTGLAIVLGAAAIATAPLSVTLPIGTALAVGLIAIGLVTVAGRARNRFR